MHVSTNTWAYFVTLVTSSLMLVDLLVVTTLLLVALVPSSDALVVY